MPSNRPAEMDIYFQDLPEDRRARVIEDLAGVGVSPKYFKLVHIADTTEQVRRWLETRFRSNQNVLVFGTSGSGKTEMMTAAAHAAGCDIIIEPTSARLPEDYGGIPMAQRSQMSDDVYRAFVKSKLTEEKLSEEVAKEIEARRKSGAVIQNETVIKLALRGKLIPTITVTDAEIDQAIKEGRYPNARIEQEFSAPDWILDIIDKYRKTGKKTVVFFDEINQAQPAVLNSLFGLIQNKKFADRKEYSIENAVVFSAAGNFYRENTSVSRLPDPLISRFDFIIYFETDWSGSVAYLKESYLAAADQCPHLAELLSDSSVTDEVWMQTFPTPRNAENFIKLLMQIELDKSSGRGSIEIQDLDQVGLKNNDRSSLALAVKRFLKELGFSAFGVQRNAADASNLTKKRMQLGAILTEIGKYSKFVDNPGGPQYSFRGMTYSADPSGAKALWKTLRGITTAVNNEDIREAVLNNGTGLEEMLKKLGLDQSDIYGA